MCDCQVKDSDGGGGEKHTRTIGPLFQKIYKQPTVDTHQASSWSVSSKPRKPFSLIHLHY